MNRLVWLVSLVAVGGVVSVGACGGGGDGSDVDASVENPRNCGGASCLVVPDGVLETGAGVAPDLSCGVPTVTTSQTDITITGTLRDFQLDTAIAGGTIAAFKDLAFTGAPAATVDSDASGAFSLVVPGPVPSRLNFKNTSEGAFDTYALNVEIDTTQATVTMTRETVSETTAAALPAIIGVRRTDGLGTLAGIVSDCAGEPLVNAIVLVSTTSGTYSPVTQTEGCEQNGCAQVYYFRNNLPAGRNKQIDSNTDGHFAVLEVPEGSYYLQVWGFTSAAHLELGEDGLKLLSEFQTPVEPDAVVTVTLDVNQSLAGQ